MLRRLLFQLLALEIAVGSRDFWLLRKPRNWPSDQINRQSNLHSIARKYRQQIELEVLESSDSFDVSFGHLAEVSGWSSKPARKS